MFKMPASSECFHACVQFIQLSYKCLDTVQCLRRLQNGRKVVLYFQCNANVPPILNAALCQQSSTLALGSRNLRNIELGCLEVRVIARGSVNSLLAVVVVDSRGSHIGNLISELEEVVVLANESVEFRAVADVCALLEGLVVVEVALAVHAVRYAWVGAGNVWVHGDVEVPVAADGAAEDEVGDFELAGCCCWLDAGWEGGGESRGREGEEA